MDISQTGMGIQEFKRSPFDHNNLVRNLKNINKLYNVGKTQC